MVPSSESSQVSEKRVKMSSFFGAQVLLHVLGDNQSLKRGCLRNG